MKADTAFRARSRAHSLLLSAGGTPIQTIAKTYQVHRVTVSAWIKKWEQHGAQSLHDHPRSGRPPTLTPDEQELAKYKSPLKGDGNHAALATGFSHLAITFATDLVDHRNGWAYSFHSATKAIKRSARCFLSAKSAICNRLRCKIENHCST